MSSSLQARFAVSHSDFSLQVEFSLPGEGISALFGPSGSGKTTCLRAMAGLTRPADGFFAVGEEIWQDERQGIFVPPHRRSIGYVFQEASLFSHLSVTGNLQFGVKRLPRGEQGGDLLDTAELLGIRSLLDRMPDELSGGERQRVAIARALLTRPRLLLMDEPLSALDLKRKQEILPYLERLHDELSIPIVYVSHAPDEVARLADHLVLLAEGRVVASGPLFETLARTDLPPMLSDDAGVVMETTLEAYEEDGLARLGFAGGTLLVPGRRDPVGARLRCRIHARDVSLSLDEPARSSILNRLPSTISELVYSETPGHVLIKLLLGGATPVLARVTERSCRQLQLVPGMALWVQVKGVALLGS